MRLPSVLTAFAMRSLCNQSVLYHNTAFIVELDPALAHLERQTIISLMTSPSANFPIPGFQTPALAFPNIFPRSENPTLRALTTSDGEQLPSGH